MVAGLFSKGLATFSSGIGEPFIKGVVFNVLIYTILVELCPESTEFKTYDNCDLLDNEANVTGLGGGAKTMMDNWGYIYPVIVFFGFFFLKYLSNL